MSFQTALSALSSLSSVGGGAAPVASVPDQFYGGDSGIGDIANNFGTPPPLPNAPVLRGGSTVTGFDYAGLAVGGLVLIVLIASRNKK